MKTKQKGETQNRPEGKLRNAEKRNTDSGHEQTFDIPFDCGKFKENKVAWKQGSQPHKHKREKYERNQPGKESVFEIAPCTDCDIFVFGDETG